MQPNVRASWRPLDQFVLWGSLARAVRTPSISENGIETIEASAEDLAAMREKLMTDQDALVEELRIDPTIVELAQSTLASR